MKLEFLKNINEYNEHAIRLYGFDSIQANKFKKVIDDLVADKINTIDLTSLEFIQSINCKLTLRVAKNDEGITTADGLDFFCDLTLNNYKNISRLIEPFCKKESNGYQWLYDIDTPIDFLFSAGGELPEPVA